MGRRGVLSSAAAGGSLIAASLVLVIGVAGLIGFRGFNSANTAADEQSVIVDRSSAAREAGAIAKPEAAVIGSARPARADLSSRQARQRKRARPGARRPGRRAAARSDLSNPVKPRTARPAVAVSTETASAPAPERSEPAAPVPATPAADVVEELSGGVDDARKPVESVGDVLLDVRDLLP